MAEISLFLDIDKAAEEAIELLKERFQSVCGVPLEDVQRIINGDLVSVTRCKDCRFSDNMTAAERSRYIPNCVMCYRLHPRRERMPMLEDDYCSYGERKEGLEDVDGRAL